MSPLLRFSVDVKAVEAIGTFAAEFVLALPEALPLAFALPACPDFASLVCGAMEARPGF